MNSEGKGNKTGESLISPSLLPKVVSSFREKKNGERGTETQRPVNSFKCINPHEMENQGEEREKEAYQFFFTLTIYLNKAVTN